MTSSQSSENLLQEARAGGTDGVGRLLEKYRNYLELLASIEIGRNLRAKLDASDLVQDTLLEAHGGFSRFRGSSETQFVCWLRQIMAASLSNLLRRYMGTQGRDVRLERELAIRLDQSSSLLDRGLVAAISSPSHQASRREQAVLLADALKMLPEDYRQVIVLRHLEGLAFADVSQRMERSLDSVEKLWVRALARLRTAMEGME